MKISGWLVCFFVALLPWPLAADTQINSPSLPKEIKLNGVEFILIPAGWFYKAGGVRAAADSTGGNAKVWLDDFYIAKYEARARHLVPYLNTLARPLKEYGGDHSSCSAQLDASGRYVLVRPEEDLPATHLSWRLADGWARYMGFRLPSEAEWEKAARGSDLRIYPWGDQNPDETYANFGATSECLVWPVDRFSKGRSPYGVFNMAGNVREFVADWHNPSADGLWRDGLKNPPLPPKFESEPMKLLKGGRWASKPPQMRVDARVRALEDDPFQCNGTRFALDPGVVLQKLKDGQAEITIR